MSEKCYGLVLFDSTSQALKAERIVKAAGVSCAVVPTPVEFASGCGISLLIDEPEVESARTALDGCQGHRVLYPYLRERRER